MFEDVVELSDKNETIVSVADQNCNGRVVASLPKPNRHHDLLHTLVFNGIEDPGPFCQGFLTSTGRYVSREEAVSIAVTAQ